MNKPVFFTSSVVILFITVFGSLYPEFCKQLFDHVQDWLAINTSWIYILAVGIILFFSVWLMFSRMADIKLGPDHSVPDYSNSSWFAMLFSAGMGIGLLFFGVAEPIMHFSSPPVGEALSLESAREAMKITFFHWGLHAWAIYAVFAVMLAYASYRKNLPLLPRSIFYPILGSKINGPIGHGIDVFCVISTLFGVATSLGFGVSQINAGLNYLFSVPQTMIVQVILIAGITLLATTSVVLGLDGGIKRLSNLNMVLVCILLLLIILLGDSVDLMKSYVQNTGAYLSDITFKTFNLYAYQKKETWIGGWTLLYWGWWISWAPFVGMFIARISKGRTIREFMVGVVFIPTGFTFLWMTVFGNTAIKAIIEGRGEGLLAAVETNMPLALFKFFELFSASQTLTQGLSLLGILLVITFFVSSSDSGSLVIDTLASGGAENPPVWQKIYWAALEGIVASVLLLAGGLDALQTMAIASAFPMIFLIMFGMFSFVKSLKEDYMLLSSVQNHTTSVQISKTTSTWQEHLQSLMAHPHYDEAKVFLLQNVEPALKELSIELKKKSFDIFLDDSVEDAIRLVIKNQGVENFYYGIRLRPFIIPSYLPEDQGKYFRAEVFILQGGQGNDVYGYTKEQIIADAINQYEKHFHFLHVLNSKQPGKV